MFGFEALCCCRAFSGGIAKLAISAVRFSLAAPGPILTGKMVIACLRKFGNGRADRPSRDRELIEQIDKAAIWSSVPSMKLFFMGLALTLVINRRALPRRERFPQALKRGLRRFQSFVQDRRRPGRTSPLPRSAGREATKISPFPGGVPSCNRRALRFPPVFNSIRSARAVSTKAEPSARSISSLPSARF